MTVFATPPSDRFVSSAKGPKVSRPWQRTLRCAALAALALTALSGCRSGDGQLPPVFGAVFGAEGARAVPFETGRIPERPVRPGDKVLGDAANVPGQCIYVSATGRRFRADCPDGYAIGDRR